MKKLSLLFVLTLAIGLGISATSIAEEETGASDQKTDMQEMKAEAMAKWMQYATPSEGHKPLMQMVGEWNYTLKYWSSPNTPPEESKGENEIKWVLGNRFLEMDVDGTSMGQPFYGMGFMGYDNAKNEYVGVWMDTMGTGIMISTGTYDAKTNTFTETGSFTDPLYGDQTFKGITKFIDEDNFTYEMYRKSPSGEEELRVMEIKYTREK